MRVPPASPEGGRAARSLQPALPDADEIVVHGVPMRLTKSARAARMACRECGIPIDLDWASCPHCSVERPIQVWRRVRPGLVMAIAMIGACLLALGVRS